MKITQAVRRLSGALLLAGVAQTSHALIISTAGSWDNSLLPAGVNSVVSSQFDLATGTTDLGTDNRISWGADEADPSDDRSYWQFDGFEGFISSIADIQIGTFTHLNNVIPFGGLFNPIFNIDILLAEDQVAFDAGIYLNEESFSFEFQHNETLNNADPCPYGGSNPCADGVEIPNASATIVVDGSPYTLQIAGFLDENGVIQPNMVTEENDSQSATVQGGITVTEPATLALFGLSLLSLGALRRRNKA